jgi:hypothetical protein
MISLPRDDLEKQEILKKIIAKFEKDKEYHESEVNEIIKSFDVDDYVLFRRELVNFNYFGKNSYKSIYWVKTHELSDEELKKISERQSKIKEMD